MLAAHALKLIRASGCVSQSRNALQALLAQDTSLQVLLAQDSPRWLCTSTHASSAASSVEAASAIDIASTSEAEPLYPLGTGWLWKTHKKSKPKTGWFAPKIGPDGKVKVWEIWDYFYWTVGIAGFSLIFGPRLYRWYFAPKPDAEALALAAAKKKEEVEAKRLSLMAAVLSGKSFLEVEDTFDGLSPKEINELASKTMGKSSVSDDPFDGMDPADIDAYVLLHGLGGSEVAGGGGEVVNSPFGLSKPTYSDDPYEGMTTEEIDALVAQQGQGQGISEGDPVVNKPLGLGSHSAKDEVVNLMASDDPFDGMSPEEIDEYAKKHGLTEI